MRLPLIAFSLLLVGCPKKTVSTEDAGMATVADAGAPIAVSTATAMILDAAIPPTPPTHSAGPTAAGAGKTPPPPPSKSVAKAATYTCKAGEVDNGEACFKPCTKDADCAKPATCQSMMVANPNGGTSTAMTCQKP